MKNIVIKNEKAAAQGIIFQKRNSHKKMTTAYGWKTKKQAENTAYRKNYLRLQLRENTKRIKLLGRGVNDLIKSMDVLIQYSMQ